MKKKLRIKYNAPVVLSMVIICLMTTLLGMFTRGKSTEFLFMIYRSPLNNLLTYIRLLTHIFGHVDWSHFMGNASMLLLLGPILEEKHGSIKLIQIITVTAVTTGLINDALFWNSALCGASGVVFAFILLTSFTNFRNGEIPITFILVTVIYLGQQVYDGLIVQDNISNLAHIVGGSIGGIFGYVLNKK